MIWCKIRPFLFPKWLGMFMQHDSIVHPTFKIFTLFVQDVCKGEFKKWLSVSTHHIANCSLGDKSRAILHVNETAGCCKRHSLIIWLKSKYSVTKTGKNTARVLSWTSTSGTQLFECLKGQSPLQRWKWLHSMKSICTLSKQHNRITVFLLKNPNCTQKC